MGLKIPTGLDVINKALSVCKEDNTTDTLMDPGSFDASTLVALNEGLRFFYGFEGRTYLKKHVNLQLVADTQDYEVNATNFAKDFLIERILEDEVQNAFGNPVTRVTREQVIKYIIPWAPNNIPYTLFQTLVPKEEAPRFWYPNPLTVSDKTVIYFSIFPKVISNQLLFIPYKVAMTEEIDKTTVKDNLIIPINDIDPLVYYIADWIATVDNRNNAGIIRGKLEEKLLESSIAHTLIDETGEVDTSRYIARLAHSGL